MSRPAIAEMLAELRAIREGLEARQRSPLEDPIVTRDEAAAMLKVSPRQLRNLVAAGRIMAHPSGISRVELERYARTPQTKLSTNQRARRVSATEEAQQLRDELKLRRGRR